jgi:hypothetical protein
MRPWSLPLIALLSIGAVLWVLWPTEQVTHPSPTGEAESLAGASDTAVPRPPAGAVKSSDDEAPGRAIVPSPELRAYRAHNQFDANIRDFLENAASWTVEVRERRARELLLALRRYEERGEVSAAESVMLQIAMIRASEPDPAAWKPAISELLERYGDDYESRIEAWRTRRDPAFMRYKQRERHIVREVLEMPEVPAGVDRGEYLRQRLLEARIEAATSADGGWPRE